MVQVNIVDLLQKNNKTKYWLCRKMNMASRNLDRMIRGKSVSVSIESIGEFCTLLNCTPNDLFTIKN